MKKWLVNPFVYVAGARALLIGLAVMLATAFVGFYSRTHFDGAMDIHVGAIRPLSHHLLEQAVDWGVVVAMFYFAALIFSASKIRFIDIAGTMALARWVMILPAIIAFAFNTPAVQPQTVNDIMNLITPQIVIMGILLTVFAIWMIALMYNAFTVSGNMKGQKGVGVFIGALLAAEILSHIILHLLHSQFI